MNTKTNLSKEHKPRALLLISPLAPYIGNNANLLSKLIPFLKEHYEICIFSMSNDEDASQLPKKLFGVPVLWGDSNNVSRIRKIIYSLIAKLTDRNGYSDAIQVMKSRCELKRIKKEFPFYIAIATIEPYFLGVAPLCFRDVKNVLYLMDPTDAIQGKPETKYRNRIVDSIIKKEDLIITTPFIKQVLASRKCDISKVWITGFPMIDRPPKKVKKKDGTIDLLFCGWLCSDIRSPQFLIKTIKYLDKRFRITFMGKDCEKLCEMYEIDTKADVITVPQQPYDVALQAMADADILINIGNSIPVHMPSKTLEYMNTGKPIVNFHKMPDCPTLYYTERYPLCLNVYEDETRVVEAAQEVIDFCLCNIGKTVDRSIILREYKDCTPQYIAEQIINGMEEVL